MTTNYVFLGSGTTDSNGVAKLDHDANGDPISHSYTGVGAGEIDVVASLDNPIASGSVVSQPYNVWDTNFGDGGVTGNTNGGFYYTQDQTVVSRQTDNTGTTVTNLTSSLQTIRVNKPNTSIDEKDWVAPLNIEFDILSYTGIVYLQLWKSNNTYENVSVNLSDFLTGVSNPHVKVLVADGKMKVYVNDELKTDLVVTFGGLFGIRLLLSNSASFKYKNFFVYGMIKDYCVVTSQNNIVGTGDDLSITGQLYLNDELALNKTLDVYKDGSKVGTASTGDTGTATYTYTGVGGGEVEFQFKYNSIVSQPSSVLDCAFLDIATTGKKNSNWDNGTKLTVSNPTDDGTTLSASEGVYTSTRYITQSSFSGDFEVVFTLSSVGQAVFGVSNSETNASSRTYIQRTTLSTPTTFKIQSVNGVLSAYYLNNGVWTSHSWSYNGANTSNPLYFAFNFDNVSSSVSMTYKDLKIYPI